MSASVIDGKKTLRKNAAVWLGVSAFCGIFSAVYEYFSHQVFSPFMVWLFAIPLLGGVLPYFCFSFAEEEKVPGRFVRNVYNSGIATLCVGSCLRGVTDIYGTSTVYEPVYWIAGGLLTAAAAVAQPFLTAPKGQTG